MNGDKAAQSYERRNPMGRFHSREGFCFERQSDGSVELTKMLYGRAADGTLSEVCAYRVTLPPNEWASVVASVSKAAADKLLHGEKVRDAA